MTTLELKLNLPDQLAKDAVRMGLTSPDSLQTLLREAVRNRRLAGLAEARKRNRGGKHPAADYGRNRKPKLPLTARAARATHQLNHTSMRLVLDTNIVASGLLWDGTPAHLIDAAQAGTIEIYTSRILLAELTRILKRAKFAKVIAASGVGLEGLVLGYAELATLG